MVNRFSESVATANKMNSAEQGAGSAELRAPESRDEILKAAIKLFANRGFHETSMAEVARAANVSKALIFWHFKTKEDLFLAVLNRLLEPYVIDFAEEAGALGEVAQIMQLVELYLMFVRDNASSIRFFVAQLMRGELASDALTGPVMQLYDGYRDLLVDLIGRAQAKDLCIKDFPAAAVARMLLSMLNGTLIEMLFAENANADVASAIVMIRQWLFGGRAGTAKDAPPEF